MKFLFGSTASSHFLQYRVNWILEQHTFQFAASLANSSPQKTYAGIQLQSISLVAKEALPDHFSMVAALWNIPDYYSNTSNDCGRWTVNFGLLQRAAQGIHCR